MGLWDLVLESCVTGRMVVLFPLKNGELDEDLGERGVRGLGPSELWALGDSGDEIFKFVCREKELRSKLGTAECRDGIFAGVNRGSRWCGSGWLVSEYGRLAAIGGNDISGTRRQRDKVQANKRKTRSAVFSLIEKRTVLANPVLRPKKKGVQMKVY